MTKRNKWSSIEEYEIDCKYHLVKMISKKDSKKHSVFECYYQEDISHYVPKGIPCTFPKEGFYKIHNNEPINEKDIIGIKPIESMRAWYEGGES